MCTFTCILFLLSISSAHAATIEEEVRNYFKDAPVMIAIAQCESKFKQFGTDGSALLGGWGGGMIGVFQIFESVHKKSASALGFDLATLEGNLGYAKHLYTQEGTTPWNSSKSCWQKATVSKTSTKDIKALEKKVAELKKLVVQLQKLLAEKRAGKA
jgi:hypothetical protein